MMRFGFIFFALLSIPAMALGQITNEWKTPFELNENQSATYQQAIAWYQKLSEAYPSMVRNYAVGKTDSGFPLNCVVLSQDGDFFPETIHQKNKTILLINNGIHPGESEGIDASMMLVRDLLQNEAFKPSWENVVLVIIPVYNVDGCLNRNSYSRTNQNGPESYGFRGNAQNLDLNRDFIKCDSRNAQTFNQLFTIWQPDLFIDNHTSNGADYQYIMTLLATQHDKLQPVLDSFLQEQILPFLYTDMNKKGWDMIPYVNEIGESGTPDEGIAGFLDLPRFSSGYAALHQTIGFVPETHMLKPFPLRVKSTIAIMESILKFANENTSALLMAKQKANELVKNQTNFPIQWVLDKNKSDSLLFKGFEAKYKPSEVSGLQRLWYDRNAPYAKRIPYYNYYQTPLIIEKPLAYIIPQGYQKVIERFEWNNIAMQRLNADTVMEVEMYYIRDLKTGANPYEGHYLHTNIQLEKKIINQLYHKGDYLVYCNQASNRYIVETLEPQSADSFFAWNFFDGILNQKEYFSAYVFEDLAAAYLKTHLELRNELEEKKKNDLEFAKSGEAQLDWVYRRMPNYEPSHRLYPIGRLMKIGN